MQLVSHIKSCYENLKSLIHYSDTQLLALTMNLILIVVNPLVFYNTIVDCPTWLILIGIPFGLYSSYQLLKGCCKGVDLSYTLILGQIIGIVISIFEKKSLFYAFIFQLVVFSFLKWRSEKAVRRKERRDRRRSC